jgi:hypothetical protein
MTRRLCFECSSLLTGRILVCLILKSSVPGCVVTGGGRLENAAEVEPGCNKERDSGVAQYGDTVT